MEISPNTLLSTLNNATAFREGTSSCGVGCKQGFSDPAFTSDQLKEKWAGKFIDFGGNGAHEPMFSEPLLSNTHARTQMTEGNVAFENTHYTINVNDRGEIKINNKETGEHYRIWGDPHVDVDGKRAFDFKGDTTFVLDDGTKVSIETTPWKGNNDQTISSIVSIIDGESAYGVRISGVDDNHLGDLAYEEVPHFGAFLDALVEDGNYVHENPIGKGFIAVGRDGWAEVDQSVMDFQENSLARLGVDNKEHGGSINSLLRAFLNNEGMTSSLTDFSSRLNDIRNSGESSSQLSQIITATLESLLSLVHHQSRSFSHVPGLHEVQSSGRYDLPSTENGFSFQLNFQRS